MMHDVLNAMRTTLDLDTDVLEAARALAVSRKDSMGKIVSELARKGLQKAPPKLRYRQGIPIYRRLPGALVTNELIDRLRAEEGV